MPSDRHASRVGASLLSRLGRDDWIAGSRQDYIDIVTSLAADKSVFKGFDDTRLDLRLSTRLDDFHFTNNLKHRRLKSDTSLTKTSNGDFQATLALDEFIFRGFLSYSLEPLTEFQSVGTAMVYEFGEDTRLNLGVTRDLIGAKLTRLRAGLSWDSGYFILTPSLDWDSDDNYAASLLLKFGLTHEPLTNQIVATSDRKRGTGAVSARVFLDNNENKVFDEGDEVLENVKLKSSARGRRRNTETDTSGVGMITNLPGGGATVVEIDETTIEDPFWLPRDTSQLVVGRPGTTQIIDFPVYNTGEVEGVVMLDDGAGNQREMGGVEVQLIDGDGEIIESGRTAHDGYYLFTLVKPGSYTVEIPKTGSRQRDFLVDPSGTVRITGEGEIVSDVNFVVRTRTDLALKREQELRRQLDEEQAIFEATLARMPTVMPRRSDPDESGAASRPLTSAPAVAPETGNSTAPITSQSPTAGTEPRSGMHLASYRSREIAESAWNDIHAQHEDLIGSMDHVISEVDLGAERGVYFRLSAVSEQQPDAARYLCDQLQRRDQYCAVSAIVN